MFIRLDVQTCTSRCIDVYTSRRLDVQACEYPGVCTSRREDVQAFRRPDVSISRRLDVQVCRCLHFQAFLLLHFHTP